MQGDSIKTVVLKKDSMLVPITKCQVFDGRPTDYEYAYARARFLSSDGDIISLTWEEGGEDPREYIEPILDAPFEELNKQADLRRRRAIFRSAFH